MDFIKHEDFKKLDLRIGKIYQVKEIPGTDKLLKYQADFNELDENNQKKLRQIISGIKEYYSDSQVLVGKQALYTINLEPKKIKGQKSQGMLVAIEETDGRPVFLIPEKEVLPGSQVK